MSFEVKLRFPPDRKFYRVKWQAGVLLGNQLAVDLLEIFEENYGGVAEVGPIGGPSAQFDFFLRPLSARFFLEYLEERGDIRITQWSGDIPMPEIIKGAVH